MADRGYSESELLAVLMSREVRDGEISACGALSMIPAAGLLLAIPITAGIKAVCDNVAGLRAYGRFLGD